MFVLSLCLLLSLGVIGIASSRQGGNAPLAAQPGLVSSSQSATKPLEPIQSAPEFSLTTVRGGELSSKELKGKVVVVEFGATWAAPFIADIPEFNQLQKKLKSQGVEIIGVVYDSGAPGQDLEPFLKQFQIEYPVAMGTTEVDQGFGGHQGYPTTFLIGRDWKVYRKILGRVPNKLANLERDIITLLAQPTN
jgi:thiol-disulfide isomerase/thioredoxin